MLFLLFLHVPLHYDTLKQCRGHIINITPSAKICTQNFGNWAYIGYMVLYENLDFAGFFFYFPVYICLFCVFWDKDLLWSWTWPWVPNPPAWNTVMCHHTQLILLLKALHEGSHSCASAGFIKGFSHLNYANTHKVFYLYFMDERLWWHRGLLYYYYYYFFFF